MNNELIAILIHTNSNYSDLWKPYCEQMKKFLNINLDVYILVDDTIPNIYNILMNMYPFKDIFIYNNGDKSTASFASRFLIALNSIPNEYILITYERYIIYDFINLDNWNLVQSFIINNKPDSFRLTVDHAVFSLPLEYVYNDIYKIPYNLQIQTHTCNVIWSKNKLINFFNLYPNTTYADLEGTNICNFTRGNNYFIWNKSCLPVGCGAWLESCVYKTHYLIQFGGLWRIKSVKPFLLYLQNTYQLDLTKRECYNCNCENGYLHNNPYYQSLKHICIE